MLSLRNTPDEPLNYEYRDGWLRRRSEFGNAQNSFNVLEVIIPARYGKDLALRCRGN